MLLLIWAWQSHIFQCCIPPINGIWFREVVALDTTPLISVQCWHIGQVIEQCYFLYHDLIASDLTNWHCDNIRIATVTWEKSPQLKTTYRKCLITIPYNSVLRGKGELENEEVEMGALFSSVGRAASHVQRLCPPRCSAPGWSPGLGPFAACRSLSLSTCFLSCLQLFYQ